MFEHSKSLLPTISYGGYAMADEELLVSKKRKGSDLSSELDTSVNSPEKATKLKQKKQIKKKSKVIPEKSTEVTEGDKKEQKMAAEINKQLEAINKTLSNVITRDDGFLRDLIREVFQQMKTEFLQGFITASNC